MFEEAQSAAAVDYNLYQIANRKYGVLLSTYRGGLPIPLGVAHVLRVNRDLIDAPDSLGQNRARGFAKASTSVARDSSFQIEDLDRPSVCAYIWGREVNRLARALYDSHPLLFPDSREDFWKTVYVKHALGDAVFNQLWALANPSNAGEVHDTLVAEVTTLKKAIPPWNVLRLKRIVQYDCEYVFALCQRRGGLISDGYGKVPTMKKQEVLQ